VWNKLPAAVTQAVLELALKEPQLSPRELAVSWTCPRVAQVIARRFGIRYHVDHIGRLLRSLGWTPQRPTRRALERDEEGIQRWIKQEWPRIKKSLAPEGMAGFPG